MSSQKKRQNDTNHQLIMADLEMEIDKDLNELNNITNINNQ